MLRDSLTILDFPAARPDGKRGLPGKSDSGESVVAPHSQDQAQDPRVQMQVIVTVDMIQGQPGLPERFKLGPDFRLERFPNARPQRELESRSRGMIGKFPTGIHQIGDFLRGQDGPAFDEDEMESDFQRRGLPGALDGIGRRRPPPSGWRWLVFPGDEPLRWLIHRHREAKIVAVEDHPSHAFPSLAMRRPVPGKDKMGPAPHSRSFGVGKEEGDQGGQVPEGEQIKAAQTFPVAQAPPQDDSRSRQPQQKSRRQYRQRPEGRPGARPHKGGQKGLSGQRPSPQTRWAGPRGCFDPSRPGVPTIGRDS